MQTTLPHCACTANSCTFIPLTRLHDAISQPLCDGVEVVHDACVAVPAQAQQLVVLPQHGGSTTAEVQRDAGLVCRAKTREQGEAELKLAVVGCS